MAPSDNAEGHDLNCLTIHELEAHAYQRMDKQTRDYYNEGADAGSTLRENSSAYDKYRVRPRVMRDVSRVDTSATIFGGFKNTIPLGVAPTAMQCLAHSDGEVGTARACRNKGVAMGLSSFSTKTLEEVAEEAGGEIPLVLQLYLFEDREESVRLIERAKKAGFKAVFLTVDTPFLGRRNLELRNKFSLPPHFKVANFAADANMPRSPTTSNSREQEWQDKTAAQANTSAPRSSSKKSFSQAGFTHTSTKERHKPQGPVTFHTHAPNPTLSWENSIPWLKETCGPEMQVWVKGVATAEDALLAVHHGCDGIVVSNHGGRQLDGALATLDALPEVAEAVAGKVPVHVDGGIRHGTDAFKALALGADFVWVGRPALWGLAYKGSEGVELMLRLLGDEFRLCMALAGVVNVEDISKDYLVKVIEGGFTARL